MKAIGGIGVGGPEQSVNRETKAVGRGQNRRFDARIDGGIA